MLGALIDGGMGLIIWAGYEDIFHKINPTERETKSFWVPQSSVIKYCLPQMEYLVYSLILSHSISSIFKLAHLFYIIYPFK